MHAVSTTVVHVVLVLRHYMRRTKGIVDMIVPYTVQKTSYIGFMLTL